MVNEISSGTTSDEAGIVGVGTGAGDGVGAAGKP